MLRPVRGSGAAGQYRVIRAGTNHDQQENTRTMTTAQIDARVTELTGMPELLPLNEAIAKAVTEANPGQHLCTCALDGTTCPRREHIYSMA
jgi:hypothetical protein